MRYFITLLFISILAALSCPATDFTLKGTVTDAADHSPLGFANVVAQPGGKAVQADGDGRWTLRLPEGTYTVTVSFIGYNPSSQKVKLNRDLSISTDLQSNDNMLHEVVITAKETQGLSTSSLINRDAMEHLQPTSFTDLLELLPGNMSKNPDMGGANTIALRETGNLSATGAQTVNDDYAISSLGTLFVVDGAPVNNDANLQNIGGMASDASSPDYRRNITNKGVDMRTISTDNIESVEIVRGIPSSEYGNLTSGLVNIKRIKRSTPFTARFKADEYSKLFSAGKGFTLPGTDHVINIDGGYLDSKVDPRNNLENYKRANFSARANMRFGSDNVATTWVYGIDYTGSFDNAKVDPDLSLTKVDEFSSSYNRMAFTSEVNLSLQKCRWVSNIVFNTSASYEIDRLTRHKQVAPQRASVAPTTMEEGVHDGKYLLTEYIADYRSDGRPLSLFAKVKATGERSVGSWIHRYKAGGDWTMSKNYGRGQIYDLTRPLSASWTTRPRAYRDIPALHVLSFYLEDEMSLPLGNHTLEVQAGLRTSQLPGLPSSYALAGKVYIDPRVNAEWNFPKFNLAGSPFSTNIAAGYGLTTKMPTIDYLYPQVNYNDFIQLNYYDVNDPLNLSRVNLMTYIDDPVNHDLKPARNNKWEVRLGGEWRGNRLTVTYFEERMNSGFRYTAFYAPYSYRLYDASAINPDGLTAPPSLDGLPSEERVKLDGFRRVTNGSQLNKRGVEFQLTTARWKPLATSLIITGAWFKSTYSNSQMQYATVSDVVNSRPVSDLYVGLYDWNDGRVNEQFNTNFMFDTQIPRWGLIFSTSIQCMWYMKTTRMWQNGVPAYYLSADGELRPYDRDNLPDPLLAYLIKNYNDDAYKPFKIPTAVYLNLKATKKIGKFLKVSAFVNRIVDYLPDYTSNGLTIRRSSNAYFGMEINLSL